MCLIAQRTPKNNEVWWAKLTAGEAQKSDLSLAQNPAHLLAQDRTTTSHHVFVWMVEFPSRHLITICPYTYSQSPSTRLLLPRPLRYGSQDLFASENKKLAIKYGLVV